MSNLTQSAHWARRRDASEWPRRPQHAAWLSPCLLALAALLTTAGCPADAPPPSPSSRAPTFTLRLTDAGPDAQATAAAVASIAGYSLPMAEKVLETAARQDQGLPLLIDVDERQAQAGLADLEAAGAQGQVYRSDVFSAGQ